MIVETFPTKKPTAVLPYYQQQTWPKGGNGQPPFIPTHTKMYGQWIERKAESRGITVDEYIRRDKLIREQVDACPLGINQIAYPIRKSEYEKYGALKIRHFILKLDDLPPTEKWPTSDRPMIISCEMVSTGEVVTCTTNYLTSTNLHAMKASDQC